MAQQRSISRHSYQMTKISGQFLISGQFQGSFKISGISGISGQLGALIIQQKHVCSEHSAQLLPYIRAEILSSVLVVHRPRAVLTGIH